MTQKIANCVYYSGDNECSRCEDGYLLQEDFSECVKNDGCVTAANKTCELCAPNHYRSSYFDIDNQDFSIFKNLLSNIIHNYSHCKDFPLVNDCTEFDESGQCQTCAADHLLDKDTTNTCVDYIDLPNCIKRKVINECHECDSLYYPAQEGPNVVCKPHPNHPTDNSNVGAAIANCEEYSNTELACIRCSSLYYVNSGVCASLLLPA